MEIEAPHNEFQYAVFGRVTKGDDTLRKLELLPTHKEGIFVMVCILQLYCFP
jgi:cyclophilin family peptidyl-prolyl cis-trans isomerase